MGDVTQILQQIESGNSSAAEELLPLVYGELRKMAAGMMAVESPDHTLQPTALVHDAYVRLVDVSAIQDWNSRGHFFIAAAEAMRRILVESARAKRRLKRGGNWRRRPLTDEIPDPAAADGELLALDEALSRLSAAHPEHAELVKLRFFGGLTIPEAAEILQVSHSTAERQWTYARAWLFAALRNASD